VGYLEGIIGVLGTPKYALFTPKIALFTPKIGPFGGPPRTPKRGILVPPSPWSVQITPTRYPQLKGAYLGGPLGTPKIAPFTPKIGPFWGKKTPFWGSQGPLLGVF